MTPQDALCELLARLGASKGAAVVISEEELSRWPAAAVTAMKSEKLLVKMRPATGVVCPGCERECSMPIHTRLGGSGLAASFVVCDKRDDINRIPIPDSMLRQWIASLGELAGSIARLLGLTRAILVNGPRCEVGILRGRKHSSHVVLIADGTLSLHIAGHVVDLGSVLSVQNGAIRVDRPALERFADKPVAGAGDSEAASERRKRLAREVKAEKVIGNRAFLKTVAEREAISIQRLKQLLDVAPESARKARVSAARRPS